MAYLYAQWCSRKLYLKPFHRFGRLLDAVDTLLEQPQASRLHAIVEWAGNVWTIRDVSRNGVWLNGTKLSANQPYPLQVNDLIQFEHTLEICYKVEDVAPPEDALILVTEALKDESPEDGNDVILLNAYHFLPSQSDAQLVMFYDSDDRSWCCEYLADTSVIRLVDGDCLRLNGRTWRLQQGREEAQVETVITYGEVEASPEFVFSLSQDEELTELVIDMGVEKINLQARSHHYLTVLLARHKIEMHNTGVEGANNGWVSNSTLARELGMDDAHVNIQIHRARKQVSDAFKDLGFVAPMLIERKKGFARFVPQRFKIFKGNMLESSS